MEKQYLVEEPVFKEIGGYVYKLSYEETHEGVRLFWELQNDDGVPRKWTNNPQDENYKLAYPLKEEEIFVAAVEVVGFIYADGSMGYRVRTSDGPISSRIGLIELGKLQLFMDSQPTRE